MTDTKSYTIAVTGDVLLNGSVSQCTTPAFQSAVALLRDADVTVAHLEVPLVDGRNGDCFPSAEAAMSWMSSPTSLIDDLRWCGIDLVTTASNHALDFSHGGVLSTISALDRANMPSAGVGATLSEARRPAIFATGLARVAVVSATSSFAPSARAADPGNGIPGRPGVNPMAIVDVIDPESGSQLATLAARLGRWVTRTPSEIIVNRPGLFNTMQRFLIDETLQRPSTRCDAADLANYLASLSRSAQLGDFVIAHLHSHEWDATDGRMVAPSAFVEQFATACVSAGASLVVVQGSHAPIRGVSAIDGTPVILDPGPLFRRGLRQPQPHEFTDRWLTDPTGSLTDAEQNSREFINGTGPYVRLSPIEGIQHSPGFVVPVCHVNATTHQVESIDFHPMVWLDSPKSVAGFPASATGAEARRVMDVFCDLAEPTSSVERRDGLARFICR